MNKAIKSSNNNFQENNINNQGIKKDKYHKIPSHIFVTTMILLLLCLLNACANSPIKSYYHDSNEMLRSINQPQVITSNINLESNIVIKLDKQNILYNLEFATYLRLINEYNKSNQHFAVAQDIIDAWVFNWQNTTGGSIAQNLSANLVNDSILDYQTKDYEKTTLNSYHALNHIALNNWTNARIEIKKMYQLEDALANYNSVLYQQTKTDVKIPQNATQKDLYQKIIQKYNFSDINNIEVLKLKNSYQNAFSHYLAGYIFEALGEYSLSRPGYLKSGNLLPLNQLPQQALDQLDQRIDNNTAQNNSYADVLLIQEIGHAPQIKSEELHLPFMVNANNKRCLININLFFPRLINDSNNYLNNNFSIDDKLINSELFVNYDLMAARYLHDQMPHIISQNITKAIKNIAISLVSCQQNNDLYSAINMINIASSMLLDHADERTWVLLPQKIYLSRIKIPYGEHVLKLTINHQIYTYNIKIAYKYQIISMRLLNNQIYIQSN